jgi:hypothetical protein
MTGEKLLTSWQTGSMVEPASLFNTNTLGLDFNMQIGGTPIQIILEPSGCCYLEVDSKEKVK